MAGLKVGGRATQPSEKQIEELFKQFNSSRSTFETRMGRYQFQRNDMCYGSMSAPSRPDTQMWTTPSAPASAMEATSQAMVIPDMTSVINTFSKSESFKNANTTFKFTELFKRITDILSDSLKIISDKAQRARALSKMIEELRKITYTVKTVTETRYLGTVTTFLGFMDSIVIEIKDFYERVQFVLIDFDGKAARELAEKEKELNKLLRFKYDRIQTMIEDLYGSMKTIMGKYPKTTKFSRYLKKLTRAFDIPVLGAISAYIEFSGSGSKYAENPTDENKDEFYIKFINLFVQCVFTLVGILLAALGIEVILILLIILAIIGIVDLVFDCDSIASVLYTGWNKMVGLLKYIEEILKNAISRVMQWADGFTALFNETMEKVMSVGG